MFYLYFIFLPVPRPPRGRRIEERAFPRIRAGWPTRSSPRNSNLPRPLLPFRPPIFESPGYCPKKVAAFRIIVHHWITRQPLLFCLINRVQLLTVVATIIIYLPVEKKKKTLFQQIGKFVSWNLNDDRSYWSINWSSEQNSYPLTLVEKAGWVEGREEELTHRV